MMSTGSVATISLTDTYGFLVYSATDLIIDAMVTEIQQLGGGAGTDLTMGIYDVVTGNLLSSTGNVVPILGLNVFPLTANVSLARGAQYYFALYCSRNANNFLRRSPNTVPTPGTWAGKSFGWRHANTRFAANILGTVGNQDNNPIWIAARTLAAATPTSALIHVDVTSSPTTLTAPASGQELLANIFTSTIGAASTINLPAAPSTDSRITVKDVDGTAGAGNSITVQGNGNNIDGAASALINSNYASLTFHYNGTQWRIV